MPAFRWIWVKKWSARFFESLIYPDTPIGIATVGCYACKWHDDLFNIIDLLGNYEDSTEVANMLTLRSVLMSLYLAQRNRRYFERRAKEIPDESRELRMSQQDRDAAAKARRIEGTLSKESNYIIACLREGRPSKIHTRSFTLAGTPSVGGTAVWGAHIGHPVTCTIVPTLEGHRIHITFRKTVFDGIQLAAARILSDSIRENLKRTLLSEITLEHYETMFILDHRWKSLTVEQQESVRSIVKNLDTQQPDRLGGLRRKPWRLRGNPEVPELLPL